MPTRESSWLRQILLNGISALLFVLMYPRPGWGLLAYVALVPMVIATLRSASGWRVFWTNYIVWLIWWNAMFIWLHPITVGGAIALSAYCAIYLPLAMTMMHWIHRRFHPPAALVLPLVIATTEFIRGTILAGGFSWFYLAHALVPTDVNSAGANVGGGISVGISGAVLQSADLFGEITVSMIIAVCNGFIVDLLTLPWRTVGTPRRRVYPTLRRSALLWVLCMVGAGLYGMYRLTQTDAVVTPGPRIAVVQTNVPQDNKIAPTSESMADDWHALLALHQRATAGQPKPDLIVWPETVVPAALNREAVAFYRNTTSYLAGREQFHEMISEVAKRDGIPIVVGAQGADDFTAYDIDRGYQVWIPDQRFNAAYLYHPDGTQADQRYNKMHRVPFGEYIPWVDAWPGIKRLFMKYLSPYDFDYSLDPGERVVVFDLPFKVSDNALDGERDERDDRHDDERGEKQVARFATPICFEDAVGRVCRQMIYGPDGSKRADVLINITNDGWYTGTPQGPQHLQIATMRCIENRVPMARSVNTGISGFIDSAGRIQQVVLTDGQTQSVEGVAVYQLSLDPRRTLYAIVGPWPMVLITIATCVLVIASWRKTR